MEDNRELFEYDGKKIVIETFGEKKGQPAILVLHGSTGVDFAQRFIAGIAMSFARLGFTVHLLHYFDGTGTKYADDATIRRHSEYWRKTVDAAVSHLKKKDPSAKLGVFGYSLGGYLAAASAIRDEDVLAAVVLAGGLDELSEKVGKRSSPVLVFHGDADDRVPVSEGRQLAAKVKKLGGEAQLEILSGEGHIMSQAAYAKVIAESTVFFKQKLATP